MLQCEYCDYYREVRKSSGAMGKTESLCEFTGFVFTRDVNELNIEHPCSLVSYRTYLERNKKAEVVTPLNKENWRITYQKYHVKPAAKRVKVSA